MFCQIPKCCYNDCGFTTNLKQPKYYFETLLREAGSCVLAAVPPRSCLLDLPACLHWKPTWQKQKQGCRCWGRSLGYTHQKTYLLQSCQQPRTTGGRSQLLPCTDCSRYQMELFVFVYPPLPLKDKIILPQKNFPAKKGSRSKVGHSPLISSNLTASLGIMPSVQHAPRRRFTQKLEHLHVSAHLRHQ